MEFDPVLFTAFVEKVIVRGTKKDAVLVFVMRDGSEHTIAVSPKCISPTTMTGRRTEQVAGSVFPYILGEGSFSAFSGGFPLYFRGRPFPCNQREPSPIF